MGILILNVLSNPISSLGTNREGRIPILPSKRGNTNFDFDPLARSPLEVTHDVSETVSRFQSQENVDVVRDAANFNRRCVESPNRSAQVCMESVTPDRVDPRLSVFCRKDYMNN